MKIYIETFGCQMNVADSEEMSRHLFERGFAFTGSKEEADVLLLNTCTVRQHAEDKTLSYIGRLKEWKRKKPARIIIVAGCASERLKKSLKHRFPHIDIVAGAKNIGEFPQVMDSFLETRPALITQPPVHEKKEKGKGFNWFKESEESFAKGKLRASGKPMKLGEKGKCSFITIMRGCNYSCSYCIVPLVRGREVYRPAEKILSEIRANAAEGKGDVLLLGQTVNSYWHREKMENGKWKITDFPDLLRLADKIEGVEEIRFMSPHPHYMTDKLIRTISECEKVSPMIHLPVQSGSDKILKLMKRNYSRGEFVAIVEKLKKNLPRLDLTTDFIVGFPEESEEDFNQTLSLADEIHFNAAYCFKYSARGGTDAFKLGDAVPKEIKEERLATLLQKIELRSHERAHLCSVA